MVSFSCEGCGDVLTKKKLDGHARQCWGASFSCLDCMTHFPGNTYKAHTACISEDQKYQGKLYKEKRGKGQHQKNDSAHYNNNSQALTAPTAHVEDATEADNSVAIVDAPPRAPTPPPAAHSLGYHQQAAIEDVNVFDFLDGTETPSAPRAPAPMNESRMLEDRQPPAYEENYTPAITDVMKFQLDDDDDDAFAQTGFSYGGEAIRPSRERFDSYTTPAPKPKHSRTKSRDTDVETTSKKTDRKRKRNSPADLDMSLVRAQEQRDNMIAEAPPMLHTGLTGGLNRLLARPEFPPSPEDSAEYANSPLSPMKRAKQGNSTALMRAQREYEAQQQKARKADTKAQRELEEKEKKDKKAKDRGRERERDRKERHASTTLVKVRSKKKREDSGSTEIRRIRRRQYSSSVSPAPQDRKVLKAIEYRPSASRSVSPDGNGQLIVRPSGDVVPAITGLDARADLFMSFITKGPESERGVSVNKALKRYHRERHDYKDRAPSKADEEKELWKNLRLKKNDRGEVVLFFSPPGTS